MSGQQPQCGWLPSESPAAGTSTKEPGRREADPLVDLELWEAVGGGAVVAPVAIPRVPAVLKGLGGFSSQRPWGVCVCACVHVCVFLCACSGGGCSAGSLECPGLLAVGMGHVCVPHRAYLCLRLWVSVDLGTLICVKVCAPVRVQVCTYVHAVSGGSSVPVFGGLGIGPSCMERSEGSGCLCVEAEFLAHRQTNSSLSHRVFFG